MLTCGVLAEVPIGMAEKHTTRGATKEKKKSSKSKKAKKSNRSVKRGKVKAKAKPQTKSKAEPAPVVTPKKEVKPAEIDKLSVKKPELGNWAIKTPGADEEDIQEKKPTDEEKKKILEAAEMNEGEEGDPEVVDPANLGRLEKLREAALRAQNAGLSYILTYEMIKKTPGAVKLSEGSNMTFSKSVIAEKSCKLKKKTFTVKIKRKKRKVTRWVAVCHWVSKPRNYVQPLGAEFLNVLTAKVRPLNHGRKIPINGLAREKAKQDALRRQGYPTAPLDTDGRYLSLHMYRNAVDLSKHLTPEAKDFIYSRLVQPFEHLRPSEKPVNVYFEGGKGSIHIEFPVTREQLDLVIKVLNAPDQETVAQIVEQAGYGKRQITKRSN